MKRRITAILLTLCMTLSLLPCDAFAEEAGLGEDGANTEEVFPEAEFADSETLESPGETGEEEIAPVEEEASSEGLGAASSSDRIAYQVEGGNIYFDPLSGAVVKCDTAVTKADIPDSINGVSVNSIGESAFSYCRGLMSVTIPNNVTGIGDYAFSHCSGLKRVTIPNSVTSIGEGAFKGCNGLTSAGPIGGGYDYEFGWTECIQSRAFSYCSGLKSVTIPNSVTSIENSAFDGCSGLTSVTIPNSVTSIGAGVFNGCSGLTSVTIPDGVTSIGNGVFQNCRGLTSMIIPNGVTSVGNYAFNGCSGLTSVIIPDSVTNIGERTFSGCSSLRSVTLPNSVIGIGEGAFSGCDSLTSVTIPNSVTSIEDYAFSSCDGLTSVTIPDSITSIGKRAFNGCSGLTSVTIPDSVTNIWEGAFNDCSSLTSVTIPGTVTNISYHVFSGCSSLMNAGPIGEGYNIEFGWAVSIPSYAFCGCSSLKSVTIPDDVTNIESGAFDNCSSLRSVAIPDDVTSIESGAFVGCSSLTDVYYGGSKIQWNAVFVGSSNVPLTSATIHYNSTGPSRIENVSFTYLSTEKEMRTYSSLVYDDNWFTQDSYVYNHDLATMSLGLFMAGVENDDPYGANGDANIKTLLGSLGFSVDGPGYQVENYGVEDNDTVGVVISKKTISDENGESIPLVVVALRGAGYGNGGWSGDFNVGAKGAYHEGFYKAADFAVKKVSGYMRSNQIDAKKMRIWLTGYSRSAATANLVSQLLSVRGICKRENIYTYTFATPNNQLINYFSSRYNNIFNIVNPIDLVPMVPLTKWNFGKQGTTYFTPYFANAAGVPFAAFDAKFQELSGYSYRCADGQPTLITDLLDMVLDTVNSRSTYYCYMESPLTGFFKNDYSQIDAIFGGKTTVEELKSLIESNSLTRPLKYAKAAQKVLSVISYRKQAFGSSDPYLKLLDKLYGLLKQLAGEYAFWAIGTPVGTSEADFVMDVLCRIEESAAFMQHWSEVYMAWMLTCDENNLTETNIYKTRVAAIKCPVDVEVYDETGNLVARTTTKTYSITDEESGEIYTDTYTVIDQEATTLESFILGDSKYFTLPDDQNYRIEIIRNENYAEGDTMTYSVTSYENNAEISSVVYEDVDLAENTAFEGNITTSDQPPETCTLSCGDLDIEPTTVIHQKESTHIANNLNVEREENTYRINGNLSAITTDILMYYVTYSESGQLLHISTQQFTASQDEQTIQISISAHESDNHLKMFFFDAKNCSPVSESIVLAL